MEITNRITKGLLHCHTEHSLMDSTLKPEILVQRAAELGAPAVAITDHGTMTAVDKIKSAADKFNKTMEEKGESQRIKPIIGVEAYIAETLDGYRLHLILMAKDHIGETEIGKFVKDTNTRVAVLNKKLRYPLGNKKMLMDHFAPGSKGYGHVIATSACVGGVLAGLHFQNEVNKRAFDKLKESMITITETKKAIQLNDQKIKEMEQEITFLTPVASQKFGAREKLLKKIPIGSSDYLKLETDLKRDKATALEAQVKIKQTKSLRNAIQKKNTSLKKLMNGYNKKKLDELEARFQRFSNSIMSEKELLDKMESEASYYDQLFGHGNFYIEIQYHGIFEEIKYMGHLLDIADKLKIPYVAANDVHMANKEDFEARETITSMRFNKLEPLRKEDRELYIKTDAELYAALSQAFGQHRAMTAMENIGRIVNVCEYKPAKAEHYPVFKKGADADAVLRKLAYEGIASRFSGNTWTDVYQKRLDYELSIIIKMGYSDYHLIDQDFINFAKKLGKMPEDRFKFLKNHIREMTYEEIVAYVDADQSNIGYVVGPGRGSAAGSLVCYLLGITNIDPIKYNLLFERFLNPERVSMPDIDTDFANGYREIAIEYVRKKYGEDAVCRIVTLGTEAAKASIRDVGRILGAAYPKKQEVYSETADRLARLIPVKPNIKISDCLENMKQILDESLEAKEIIRRAIGIEGTVTKYGMHAAGVIISDNDDVGEYVPLMIDENTGNWKCQCDMVEAESRGMLKMDFLGLRNLNIITDTLRMIYRKRGIWIDPDKDIIEDHQVIKSICGTGKTNSVFQLESGGMKEMLIKFGPDSFEDLILLVAAYRPGPMDSIPDMISVKHGKKQAEYAVPQLEPILSATYGSIIYQEQVQQICQVLAGYSLGQADLVRRAMSKKKEKLILAEKVPFIHGDPKRNIKGCIANGIPEEVAEDIFNTMVDFAKYAFNKSHAAAYARVTYITAWLKYNYPEEFLCVAMKHARFDKVQGLIEECKEYGIEVLPPDVNESFDTFTLEGNQIRFGFTSVKGIGNVTYMLEAREKGKFGSLAEFIKRGHINSKITEAMINSGAFDKFCNNRRAILCAAQEMICYNDILKKASAKLSSIEKLLALTIRSDLTDLEKTEIYHNELGGKAKKLPALANTQQQYEDCVKEVRKAEEELNSVLVPVEADEDFEEKLEKEKELLGVYITGHPLDAYEPLENCINIGNLVPDRKTSVMGIIRDLRVTKTKKTGEEMAFFVLEDKTDTVDVVCFPSNYSACKDNLYENAVLIINGKVVQSEKEIVNTDENGNEDTEYEVVNKIFCNACKPATKKSRDIIMEIHSILDWMEIYLPAVSKYKADHGYRLVLHDNLRDEYRTTALILSPAIKDDIKFDCRIA